MQNGDHSNTGGLASPPVLRASGGLGTRADDVGAQDGVGHGSTLVRSDAAIRGRSDRRSGSISDRLSGSGGVGHDLPDAANKVGVDGVAGSGARGSLSGLRGGPGLLSYSSSAVTTGPIVGASEIRLRFALRLGQEECTHTRSGRATGAQVAQVIVFRDNKPAMDAIRA
jgi:hypothetical protein